MKNEKKLTPEGVLTAINSGRYRFNCPKCGNKQFNTRLPDFGPIIHGPNEMYFVNVLCPVCETYTTQDFE